MYKWEKNKRWNGVKHVNPKGIWVDLMIKKRRDEVDDYGW